MGECTKKDVGIELLLVRNAIRYKRVMATGDSTVLTRRHRDVTLPASAPTHSFRRFPSDDPTRTNDQEAKDAHRMAIYGLSKVNFFIGTNNSGKSRLLRALLTDIEASRSIPDDEVMRAFELVQQQAHERAVHLSLGHNADFTELVSLYKEIASCPHLMKSDQEAVSRADHLGLRVAQFMPYASNKYDEDLLEKVRDATTNYVHFLNQNRHRGRQADALNLYIPALRTLRRIYEIDDDSKNDYAEANVKVPTLRHSILKSYFRPRQGAMDVPSPRRVSFERKNAYDCFTGEEFYEILVGHLLGNLSQRDSVNAFLAFLSQWFFQGARIDIIPDRDAESVKIKIGDEREELIHDLGDGLQQIIILTAPFFFAPPSTPLRIFVEEPELYLHAGLQTTLAAAWSRLCGEQHQVFATTHSNHFLDRTADTESISVYAFTKTLPPGEHREKQANVSIQLWSHDDLTILSALGVRNSSVLLTNATIWVEGITDRMYVRRIIDLLQQKATDQERVSEGTHFSFVEYGGSAITHWSFAGDSDRYGISTIDVNRLCSKLFVITDKMHETAGGISRRGELTKRLNDRFYELRCREVENLLSPVVLSRTVKQLTDCDLALRDDDYSAYKDQGLGHYLKLKLARKSPRVKLWPNKGAQNAPVASDYKVKFAEVACGSIETATDLSEEAMRIGKKLLKFIREQNSF